MGETIGYNEISRMLAAAAGKIRANHEQLSKLDSAIGDGDHGITMLRAIEALDKALEDCDGEDIKSALYNVGWNVLCIDGGSTGPLLGSFFMGMSESVGGSEKLDCAAVAGMFEAGLATLRKHTKAQTGDKTMIDALVPAVEAMRAAAHKSPDVGDMMRLGAEAAEQGAASTARMRAGFGRAKNLGDRSIGHIDPGAASISYIFQGFAEGLSPGK